MYQVGEHSRMYCMPQECTSESKAAQIEIVRCEKALAFSGRQIQPGNWFAPPGGNRSWLFLSNEKHVF
jgi:hypothetical protein